MEDLLNSLLNFTTNRTAIDQSRMYVIDLINKMDLTKNILLTWEAELMINKMYGDVNSKINLVHAMLRNLGKSYSGSLGDSIDSNSNMAGDRNCTVGNFQENYRSCISEKNSTITDESSKNREYCTNNIRKDLKEKESNSKTDDCMNDIMIYPMEFPKKNIGIFL